MTTADDMELLREYAARNSETAFATLVSRHINLVHAVAMRHTGNTQHAEEITQAVFIILARKAGALRAGTVLSGWLFHTTRLTAANFVRTEIRRKKREQEAYMQSILQETSGDEAWRQLAPLLDKAVAGLGEKDRNAVVLRYVEGKDLKEVGMRMGTSESAAQRRLSRALEKLRKFFSKRGVMLTGAVLAASVSANAAPAAPPGLASAIAATAASKGATAGASIVALANGTIKLMAWAKVKFAIAVATACLALAGGVVALDKLPALSGGPQFADGLTAADIAKKVEAKYASLTSYRDSGSFVSAFYPTMADYHLGKPGSRRALSGADTWKFSMHLGRPGFYQVETVLHATNAVGGEVREAVERHVGWSSGDGDFAMSYTEERLSHLNGADGPYQHLKLLPHPKLYYRVDQSKALKMSMADTIPRIFFEGDASLLPGQGAVPSVGLLHGGKLTRGPDEKIGDVDCFVLTNEVPARAQEDAFDIGITWIGKDDLLVHQWRAVDLATKEDADTGLPAAMTGTEIHENIVINEPVTKDDFAFVPPPDAVFTNLPK